MTRDQNFYRVIRYSKTTKILLGALCAQLTSSATHGPTTHDDGPNRDTWIFTHSSRHVAHMPQSQDHTAQCPHVHVSHNMPVTNSPIF